MSEEWPGVKQIRSRADEQESRFERTIQQTEPDELMMWYSELFIFAQLCELSDCTRVVESGRARGVSTEVLATYFEDTDIDIVSIEKQVGTEHAAFAERKLEDYENVEVRYGDSRALLPPIVDDSTGVVIDGPKGDDALVLALSVLDDTDVPFVAVHDLHKDAFYRELSEILFNHRLYTDAAPLVDRFQQYDTTYFEWKQEHSPPGQDSDPYLKNGTESASYGPTLGIFFNGDEPFEERVRENYLEYLEKHEPRVLSAIGSRLEEASHSGGPVGRRIPKFALEIGRTVFR